MKSLLNCKEVKSIATDKNISTKVKDSWLKERTN